MIYVSTKFRDTHQDDRSVYHKKIVSPDILLIIPSVLRVDLSIWRSLWNLHLLMLLSSYDFTQFLHPFDFGHLTRESTLVLTLQLIISCINSCTIPLFNVSAYHMIHWFLGNHLSELYYMFFFSIYHYSIYYHQNLWSPRRDDFV